MGYIYKAIGTAAALLLKAVTGVLYGILKCLPVRKKVLFLSRQSDRLSLDFQLLREELLRRDPNLEIAVITCRLEKNIPSILRFAWSSLASMYHLATASVCVLDTYWPMVSLLTHRKSLTVIQMWHAIGKMKQSGYQSLGKGYGRGKMMAQLMNMHKGYDVVIAGGASMNSYYCASFGVEEAQLWNIGLPRIDYLLHTQQQNRGLLLEKYPRLRGKTVVLYAPTFRRGTVADYSELIAKFPSHRFALVVRPHPLQTLKDGAALEPYRYGELSTMQLLTACDLVITDYSAISFEAAVMEKPIYYYLFEHQNYLRSNGVNINPYDEMPHNTYEDADLLIRAIEQGDYDMDALLAFRKRYLPETLGASTSRLAGLIADCMKDGKDEGIRKNLNREAEAAVSVDH